LKIISQYVQAGKVPSFRRRRFDTALVKERVCNKSERYCPLKQFFMYRCGKTRPYIAAHSIVCANRCVYVDYYRINVACRCRCTWSL